MCDFCYFGLSFETPAETRKKYIFILTDKATLQQADVEPGSSVWNATSALDLTWA